ncbi:MAG: fibronectin type III domain-containing protein [Acidobacteriota bacterium]
MAYEELDLAGMNIDSVRRRFSVLKASFGDGYELGARVGAAAGTHRWSLSSGCLPGDGQYGNLIDLQPRFDYYWDFFQRHVANGNAVFVVEFRGKKYHAAFIDTEISAEVFTADLFGGGVEIEQRRVFGAMYFTDGSADVSVPSVPENLTLTVLSSTSIRVAWDAATTSDPPDDSDYIVDGGTS